jgi:hypothetical protein
MNFYCGRSFNLLLKKIGPLLYFFMTHFELRVVAFFSTVSRFSMSSIFDNGFFLVLPLMDYFLIHLETPWKEHFMWSYGLFYEVKFPRTRTRSFSYEEDN